MAILNSQIIICKGVKMDKGYTNVVDYTEAQMLQLCNSSGVFVASYNNFSFIRKNRNTISADFTYEQAIQCNYMAFQNPDYSNKWFFAWIDDIEYKGEKCVEIRYTVDEWSTWHNEMTFNPVMVEREHANLDYPRSNLEPENISSTDTYPFVSIPLKFKQYDLSVTRVIKGSETIPGKKMGLYPMISKTFVYDASDALPDSEWDIAVDTIEATIADGSFVNASIYPTVLNGRSDLIIDGQRSRLVIEPVELTLEQFLELESGEKAITYPTRLGGYEPVNQKLLTYPYCYIRADDNQNQRIYKYEDFDPVYGQRDGLRFYIRGFAASPQAEVELIPAHYNNKDKDPFESLTIRDFPQLPASSDTYKAWLAQKANSALLSTGFKAATGAATGLLGTTVFGASVGGPVGAAVGAGVGLLGSLASVATEMQQAKDAPDSARGGGGSGAIDIAYGDKGFTISLMSIKEDRAKVIDNFFSQFGYATNRVKVPNFTGRQFWNYVKINGICGSGPMPEASRMAINSAMNSGLTIWHSHDYLGNYLIGGEKMQNPIV